MTQSAQTGGGRGRGRYSRGRSRGPPGDGDRGRRGGRGGRAGRQGRQGGQERAGAASDAQLSASLYSCCVSTGRGGASGDAGALTDQQLEGNFNTLVAVLRWYHGFLTRAVDARKLTELMRDMAALPLSAQAGVRDVMSVYMDLRAREAQVRKAAAMLRGRIVARRAEARFTDAEGAAVPADDEGALRELLLRGELFYGNAPLTSVLAAGNETLRAIVSDRLRVNTRGRTLGADRGVHATFQQLLYSPSDNHFYAAYGTNAGVMFVRFAIANTSVSVDAGTRGVFPATSLYDRVTHGLVTLLDGASAEDVMRAAGVGTRAASASSTLRTQSLLRPRSARTGADATGMPGAVRGVPLPALPPELPPT